MRRLLWVLTIACLGWFVWQKSGHRLPFLPFPPSTYTLLLVGLDEGNRADAIFLVYFNAVSGVQVLILPRDIFCSGGRKVNALYKRLGAQGFKSLISQIVHHPIEGFIAVPFKDLPKFFEQAFPDGLEIYVPYRLKYADRAGGFSYDIPAGYQKLSGRELAFYLRDRYSDPLKRGESARVERWEIFAEAAFKELRKPHNLPRLPLIASWAYRTFPNDLQLKDFLRLAQAILKSEDIHVDYLPGRSVRINGIWFVQLDKEATRKRAAFARKGILIPSNTRIWVLNGTSQPFLASRVSKRLEHYLGHYCFTGNALSAFEKTTTVKYSEERLAPLAYAIAAEIKARKVLREKSDSTEPLIVVTLGNDFKEQERR